MAVLTDSALTAVLELSHEAALSIELKSSTIRLANAAAYELFHKAQGELAGAEFEKLFAPEAREAVGLLMERLAQGNAVRNAALPGLIGLSAEPVADEAGVNIAACVFVRRISGTHTTSDENAELQVLLDAVPAFIAYVDRNYCYVRVNRAYQNRFGLTPDQTRSMSVMDVFGPEYFNRVRPLLERAMAGETVEFQSEAFLPPGEWRRLFVRYTPDRRSTGEIDGVIAVTRDITRDKEIEEELHHAIERFEVALRNSRTGIFEQDLALRYTWAHSERPAIPIAHMLGKTDWESNPGPWSEEMMALKREVLSTGEERRKQFSTIIRGRAEMYDMTVQPLRDQEGRITGIRGSATNITELKRIEQELRDAQAKYRLERERFALLFDQAPVGIAVLRGDDLVFEMANSAYHDFLPNRQVVGCRLVDVIPELDPAIADIVRGVITSGEPFRAQELHVELNRPGDGTPESHWFDVLFHPVREFDNSIQSMMVVARDVTSRVLMSRKIQQQWHMFDTALSNTPYFVYILDRDGRFEYANRPFAEMFGRRMEDVVGKQMLELGYPADLNARFMRQIQQVIDSERSLRDVIAISVPEGQDRLYEYILSPIVLENGRVDSVAVSSRDITEHKRNVDQLQHSLAELRRTNRELEEFAYVASHDLQEPLRTVNAYAQLLLKRFLPDDEEAERWVGFVGAGTARMQELLRDLLSFSRVIHAEGSGRGESDLAQAVGSAVKLLRDQIEEAHAELEIEPLPIVRGDSVQLVHVFQNLLSNAVKYRRPEVPLKIQVSCQAVDSGWQVSVRDNGIGFKMQYADRIFGLFKRLHREEYPGTGLGLAICQRIIERSGGRIWAESVPGEGSVFRFTLPRVDAN